MTIQIGCCWMLCTLGLRPFLVQSWRCEEGKQRVLPKIFKYRFRFGRRIQIRWLKYINNININIYIYNIYIYKYNIYIYSWCWISVNLWWLSESSWNHDLIPRIHTTRNVSRDRSRSPRGGKNHREHEVFFTCFGANCQTNHDKPQYLLLVYELFHL